MRTSDLISRTGRFLWLAFLCCTTLTGAEPRPISLLPHLGDLHHPVSTTNAMAQRFFDQGLTFIFGFNHDAAIRSFRRALEYDPNLAMAHWGIGLALGPNINLPVSAEAEKAAYDETQKAVALKSGASEAEHDYIDALARRYSVEPGADLKALDRQYSDAMRELAQKYPDDLDAATLFAESLMDLRPWQLWTPDGKPAEGTMQAIEMLESVLRRDPMHPGANHYYIHAVEASPFPERAIPSAERLEVYAPAAGHLAHMPAHVYIRVGDYAAAARRNEVATEVDLDFIQACGVQGIYPAAYTSHNMHFASVAHTLQGRYAPARRYAERLQQHVKGFAEQIPVLESFLPTLEQVLVAFEKWEDILALPQPAEKFKLHRGLWHYARGMALAATGDGSGADKEWRALVELRGSLAPDTLFGQLNKADNVFTIAEKQLAARIAVSRSEFEKARQLLQEAVRVEDGLRYIEPPDWFLFSREALGGVLLSEGKFSEAEAVFRKDLEVHRRNGRTLYGLQAALGKQGRTQAAKLIGRGLEKAWENADTELAPAAIWWVSAK